MYQGTEEETIKAIPQIAGKRAHESMKEKRQSTEKWNPSIIRDLPVYSENYGLIGIADEYDPGEGVLTEYKNNLVTVFQGQILQLECYALCLEEMGIPVNEMRLAGLSEGNVHPVAVPNGKRKEEIGKILDSFRRYDPEEAITVSLAKCRMCIYCALCEKSDMNNDF